MARIFVRVDSSTEMGSGHVMRCLTLAHRLRECGNQIAFVCRALPGCMGEYIASQSFTLHRLIAPSEDRLPPDSPNPPAQWLGVDWQEDAEETSDILARDSGVIDWLIVDHYALDHQWETQLRPYTRKIMVIDDLADRSHDCDVVLDQNLYERFETRYDKLVPDGCQKLLGPRYALLRPEFLAARQTLRKRDGNIKRVFIFFGGSDPTNETGKALEAIARLNRPDICVDVVVGGANPHRSSLEESCASLPNTIFHCQINNMAELMASADLAIGAGGSTTWERCCLGLPSIVISLAPNQETGVQSLATRGGHLYLGRVGQVKTGVIAQAVQLMIRNPGLGTYFGNFGKNLVDGRGANRVAGKICPSWEESLSLRLAQLSDCDNLFSWRNAPESRRYSMDNSPLAYEDHVRWFNQTLKNPNRILLIGQIGREAIGVVRYDLTNTNSAKVSIYLVPGKYGQGFGPRLLILGNDWIKAHCPHVQVITAEILSQNQPSIKAFLRTGFQHHSSTYTLYLKSQ